MPGSSLVQPSTASDMLLEAKLQASSKTKLPNQEDRLARYVKWENEVIVEVGGTLDMLKGLMARVKTDGVKDSVDRLTSLFDVLLKNRDEIKSEYRTIVVGKRTRADSLVVETKTYECVVASEVKIFDALGEVTKRLDNHEALITNLTLEASDRKLKVDLTTRPDMAVPWTEVVRKPRRSMTKSKTELRPDDSMKPMTKTPRSRPLAVIVNPE